MTFKRPLNSWFDRINRYRWAAFILVIPFFLTVISMDLQWVDIPLMVRRVIYWIGLAVLLTAVALDSWEVYRGKRRVNQMINDRLVTDKES